jgi:hypothetical protein
MQADIFTSMRGKDIVHPSPPLVGAVKYKEKGEKRKKEKEMSAKQ